MKLRTYLFLSNIVSLASVLISLFVIYHFMLLTWSEVILLMSVTLVAALISIVVHTLIIRPIVHSVHSISEASSNMSEGDFEGEVPVVGPSEFKQLALQFNEMKHQLEDSILTLQSSETSRKELIANVSHDLRTPLSSIQSYVEALQDRVIEDEETSQQYLRTIHRETLRLSKLIEDLFQLSRLDAGRYPFQPEPYPLDALLVETLESQSLFLEEKQLSVSTELPDPLPPVSVMPFEIKRVLGNLLQNAISYSPPGAAIRITAGAENGFVTCTFIDEGAGMAPEELDPIFERFYRIDKSRNRHSGGAGLGLAISKSIMERHGGTIRVESQLGEGSRFILTLPIACDPDPS
ncbi:sensor histidine kinase [Marinicrinis sediminis]|uniref:histidine kinase n=1 Tax=Marinicrinis sediminis TaxID=1652465 RepID=A0ABW5R590_9BACL